MQLIKARDAKTALADHEQASRCRVEEELKRTKDELARTKEKANIVSSGGASTGKEVELQEERNKLMVSPRFS